MISDYPIVAHHLSPNAQIVHDPDFESAVVKIQSMDEATLTQREIQNMKPFKKDNGSSRVETDNSANTLSSLNYAQRVILAEERRKRQRLEKHASIYKCLNHTSPTSNIYERLFSQTKLIMNDRRKSMEPYHLELLIFLQTNRNFVVL